MDVKPPLGVAGGAKFLYKISDDGIIMEVGFEVSIRNRFFRIGHAVAKTCLRCSGGHLISD